MQEVPGRHTPQLPAEGWLRLLRQCGATPDEQHWFIETMLELTREQRRLAEQADAQVSSSTTASMPATPEQQRAAELQALSLEDHAASMGEDAASSTHLDRVSSSVAGAAGAGSDVKRSLGMSAEELSSDQKPLDAAAPAPGRSIASKIQNIVEQLKVGNACAPSQSHEGTHVATLGSHTPWEGPGRSQPLNIVSMGQHVLGPPCAGKRVCIYFPLCMYVPTDC